MKSKKACKASNASATYSTVVGLRPTWPISVNVYYANDSTTPGHWGQ